MTRNAPNPSSERSGRSRYPGTRPFRDSNEDRALFFGRAEASEELYLRVLSVRLLVQFGKSGLGKTSLLQASLFPRLRQKPFLPVMIRLNVVEEALAHAVARSIEQACAAEGLMFPKVPTEGLWELLSSTLLWRDDLLLTPVLVFDQFEEIFTLHDAPFRAELASELGALATGIAPNRLSPHQANAPRSAKAPEVKIVLSLREENYGDLQELSAAIPGLFHERLQLAPLKEEEAREAITAPAQLKARPGEEPYWSPRFDFDSPALDDMFVCLKGKSGVIEPFALQLLCRHAEAIAHDKAGGKDGPVTLTRADFEGAKDFESVLRSFYLATLKKLPFSMRKKAEELCEQGLLDRDGRRLMLEEGQIRRDYGLNAETLDILAQERLVRWEPRLESVFYEISHDQLAKSISKYRGDRLPRKVRRQFWLAGITALVIVLVLLGATLYTYDALNKAERERQKAEALLSFLLGEEFLGRVRDTGSSTMLEQVRTKVGPDEGQWAALNRGLALRNAGDIERTKGKLETSVEFFGKALEVIKSSPDNHNPDKPREIARTHERMGEALADQGQVTQALSHYQAGLEAWRQVLEAASPGAADDCTSLADSLVSAGDLKRRMGDAQLALADLDAALEIVSGVLFGRQSSHQECSPAAGKVEPYPNGKALEVLSRAAMVRANVLNFSEDYEGTAKLAMEARRLRPPSISARTNALAALIYLGDSRSATPSHALDDYRRGLAGYEELRRWDPDNRRWQQERSANQLRVSAGILACAKNKTTDCKPEPSLEEAQATTLEAIATLRALAQSDPSNVTSRFGLGLALQAHSDVLAALDRQKERLTFLEKSEQHFRDSRIDSADADATEMLANLLISKSEALEALGQRAAAKATLQNAIELFDGLIVAHKDTLTYVADQSAAFRRKAEILRREGDETGAEAAKAEKKKLDEKYDTWKGKWQEDAGNLAELLVKRMTEGEKMFGEGDNAAALREFNAAESVARENMHFRPNYWGTYNLLYYIYGKIAATQEKLRNSKEQTHALSAAMHAARIAFLLVPDEGEKSTTESASINQTLSRRQFGKFLYDNTRLDEALAVVQELVVVADGLVQKNRENARYLQTLGNAKCGLGIVRRGRNEAGWEEAIRSGLIDSEKAAEVDKQESDYPQEVGRWRKYLAKELKADGRKEEALEEQQLALKAYREAARRAPDNEEIRKAIRDLAEDGVQ
jgi:hypothetical protein